MKRFNLWLARKITAATGTMWTAYLFAALAFVSLPAVISTGSATVIVAWVAQTFLQLVLLPIIMVGQNVSSEKQDELLGHHREHHRALVEILDRLKP